MIERPIEMIQMEGLVTDLLWSDPDRGIELTDAEQWTPNPRGLSVQFGPLVVQNFCEKNDVELICRAHQVLIGAGAPFCKSYVGIDRDQLIVLFEPVQAVIGHSLKTCFVYLRMSVQNFGATDQSPLI